MSIGVYLEERHPVDEALGCMVPIVVGIVSSVVIIAAITAIIMR